MAQIARVHGKLWWRAGVCVLALALTGCDLVDDIKCRSATGPLAMPFCEDLAAVPQSEYAKYHARFLAVANSLMPEDTLKEQPQVELQSPEANNHIVGEVMAFKGALSLTKEELRARPRIIARTFTSANYAHGLHGGFSYIVVDGRGGAGWRVLVVSDNPSEPVSVLYDNVFKKIPPKSTDSSNGNPVPAHSAVTVDLDDKRSLEAWRLSLSESVRNCYVNRQGSCFVNTRKTGEPDSGGRRLDPLDEPLTDSDVWVWLTGQGCICMGTQCHSNDVKH